MAIMLRLAVILASLLALTGAVRAQQDDGPSAAEKARIESLISKLDGDDFDERETSFRELVAMGPKIRPTVEAARERVGLEVRLRLETLLEALGNTVEKAAVSLEPTLVTVEAEASTFASAVAQLRRQGVVFHSPIGVALDERVDLALRERPILEVLDALGDQLSMRWSVLARDGSVRFNGRQVGKPLRYYAGPMRFMLTAASRNATRMFGEELRQTSYIQGMIDLEPEAQILGIWHPPMVEEISSPSGVSMVDDTVNQRHNFNPSANRTSFHFSTRVKLPDEPTDEIVRFAGHVVVALPGEYQVVTMPISRKAVESSVSAGGVKATLESLAKTKTGWEITVFLEREKIWADDDQRQNVKDQIFELLTASGMTVAPSKPVVPRVDPKGERCQLQFETDERPESLTIRSLKSIEKREIPFEFKNVPLP